MAYVSSLISIMVAIVVASLEVGLSYSKPTSAPAPTPAPTRHNHNAMHHQRRLENAFNTQMLTKLDLEQLHETTKFNVSVAEVRRMVREYRISVEETSAQSRRLYTDTSFKTQTFNSYPGRLGRLHHNSEFISSGDYHIHMPVDLRQPEDPLRELHVESSILHLHQVLKRQEGTIISRLRHQKFRLDVYEVLSPVEGTPDPPMRLLESKMILRSGDSGIDLDITKAVQHWADHPHRNFGIVLRSSDVNLTETVQLILRDHDQHETGVQTSYLSVYTTERSIIDMTEEPASEADCSRPDDGTKCCRHPIWISFADIGWDDWVVAPKGYQAYYCDGSCANRAQSANNFALIKTLLHGIRSDSSLSPCCTATSMSPLSILHHNTRGHLTVSVLDDMIVNSCGCS